MGSISVSATVQLSCKSQKKGKCLGGPGGGFGAPGGVFFSLGSSSGLPLLLLSLKPPPGAPKPPPGPPPGAPKPPPGPLEHFTKTH